MEFYRQHGPGLFTIKFGRASRSHTPSLVACCEVDEPLENTVPSGNRASDFITKFLSHFWSRKILRTCFALEIYARKQKQTTKQTSRASGDLIWSKKDDLKFMMSSRRDVYGQGMATDVRLAGGRRSDHFRESINILIHFFCVLSIEADTETTDCPRIGDW